MNAIVVGCGRIGAHLARTLSMEGNDVAVVDLSPGSFARLGSGFNGLTMAGYGYDEVLLRRAGAERCDAFAAVTGRDSANIMAAEVAVRIFRIPRVVVRLVAPESEGTMLHLGLDYVYGTSLLSQAILDRMAGGHPPRLARRGDVEVVEFVAGPSLEGRTVRRVQVPGELTVCLVTREGASFIPRGDTVLRARDLILAAVRETALPLLRRFSEGGDVRRDQRRG